MIPKSIYSDFKFIRFQIRIVHSIKLKRYGSVLVLADTDDSPVHKVSPGTGTDNPLPIRKGIGRKAVIAIVRIQHPGLQGIILSVRHHVIDPYFCFQVV